VVFEAAAGSTGTIALPAADASAGALAADSTWGIGPATYPGILNLNGIPISFPISTTSKISNFIGGSNSFQKVEFDSCDLLPGPGYAICSNGRAAHGWSNGEPRRIPTCNNRNP
jgi:hypothetical protein